ncbi:MAG: hypothetical protein PQ964_05135 [Methanobacteriaceae archaeon]
MSIDPLEEMFKDPDRIAKLYLLFVGLRILSIILIVVGTLIFILWALGIFKF